MVSHLKKSCFSMALVLIFGLVTVFAVQAQSKFPTREWMKLDTRTKLGVMQAFIDAAKRDGVTMRFPPEYYIKEVDAAIDNTVKNRDEKTLTVALGIMIHTIAAMDGDWDNGQDRLEVAEKWLGPDNFAAFKETFPEKYARLLKPRQDQSNPWKYAGASENHIVYYHAESPSHVPWRSVRVWVKMQRMDTQENLTEPGKQGIEQEDRETYDYSLYLYKIDCSTPSFAVLARYRYGKDKALIDASDFEAKWANIPPYSAVGHITRAVCRESKPCDRTKTRRLILLD